MGEEFEFSNRRADLYRAYRPLPRRNLKEHVSDDARAMLAKKVIEHLELSGFTIDEFAQTMTKRRGHHGHG
jgi:hypothetical protein